MKRQHWAWTVGLMLIPLTAVGGLWKTDYEESLKTAKEENRFLLLDFTGSDWCGWCKKLDKEVFSKKAFKEFAAANLICVELDFPRGKKLSKDLRKQNGSLAKKFGVRGYPTVIVLDPAGKKLATTGYRKGGADKYVEYLQKLIEPRREKFPAKAGKTSTGRATQKREYAMRNWTSTSGNTIKAKYSRRAGSLVYLIKPDGSELYVEYSRLSDADKQYLRK